MVGSSAEERLDGRWLPRASQRANALPPPWSSSRFRKIIYDTNELFRGDEFTELSRHRSAIHGLVVEEGRGGVGWNDFQIKRKIKGRLVKFRNSWRVHRVPGFRISGGEAKR